MYTAVAGSDMPQTLQIVRATSPFFRTAEDNRVGSTLAAARQACGPLVLAAPHRVRPQSTPRHLYDNARAGISFEPDGVRESGTCTAVLVHVPGKALKSNYSSVISYQRLLAGR